MYSEPTNASAASDATNHAGAIVEARFIPQRYEPNYAYPLLVMFHGRGANEQQMLRAMPTLSWRNYVGVSLRGPDAIVRPGRAVSYGWGPQFGRPDRVVRQHAPAARHVAARTSLFDAPADPVDQLEDAVFHSIRQIRRSLHIHSERIFLVGNGEGAAVAFRLGLMYPEKFAGVVSINGWIPNGFRPLGRLKAARELKVLAVHGEWNGKAPVENTRRSVQMLRNAGMRVSFQSYPCAHRMTSHMLSDVDTWIINQCTGRS